MTREQELDEASTCEEDQSRTAFTFSKTANDVSQLTSSFGAVKTVSHLTPSSLRLMS